MALRRLTRIALVVTSERSMNEANQAFNDPLSDRAPISVDLVTGACPL
jgi:hypothetical protein